MFHVKHFPDLSDLSLTRAAVMMGEHQVMFHVKHFFVRKKAKWAGQRRQVRQKAKWTMQVRQKAKWTMQERQMR